MNSMDHAIHSCFSGRRVLVTGADGFIGSHLTEALVRQGTDVTALSLYNSFDSFGWLDDLPRDIRASTNALRGDLRDAAFTRRLMKREGVVFHLAALIAIPHSYEAAQSYVETNILGTLNVLEASREHDIERIVHTSTSEVYGTALTMPIREEHPLQGQSPYSASKIGADMMAEAYTRSFGTPVVILRPFNTFGPRQSERAIIPSVLRQALDPRSRSIEVGDITTVRDFTFVEDTVEAFLAIGGSRNIVPGQPYNAGSGSAVTIAELIDLAVELVGCDKPVEQNVQRTRPERSEVRALLADSTKLRSAAGWQPRVSLRFGLERTIDWWRERLSCGRVREDVNYTT